MSIYGSAGLNVHGLGFKGRVRNRWKQVGLRLAIWDLSVRVWGARFKVWKGCTAYTPYIARLSLCGI